MTPGDGATVAPFSLRVTDAELADLRARLHATRWPEPETVDDWSQGVPLTVFRDLCGYWADGYDWRTRETRFTSFPQFRTTIDGLGIHFLHVRSPEPDALPVVLTHGWPGSVVEFFDVIGPLADPAAHGGTAADAFHVIVPSLPGYGWSDRPTAPGWDLTRIADAWAELMTRLGYDRFGAQGGDWGAGVTTGLAQRHPERLIGIHLNLLRGEPAPGQTEFGPEEQAFLDARAARAKWEYGYSEQQATRPQTLAYGLTDSPAGQCAWILEKFKAWTDCDGDPIAAFGADRVLDNVMAYWLPATAGSSARLYWESFRALWGGRVEVPVGASVYPRENFRMPRAWAERHYVDLRHWHELDRGGHFPAFEVPDVYVAELREFFAPLR